jgi:hypothetical protein
MATKKEKEAAAKKVRATFKEALESQNWRRADACINEMIDLGYKSIAQQMQKMFTEARGVDALAKSQDE